MTGDNYNFTFSGKPHGYQFVCEDRAMLLSESAGESLSNPPRGNRAAGIFIPAPSRQDWQKRAKN
jgi:hypothetical protein